MLRLWLIPSVTTSLARRRWLQEMCGNNCLRREVPRRFMLSQERVMTGDAAAASLVRQGNLCLSFSSEQESLSSLAAHVMEAAAAADPLMRPHDS